MVGAVAVGTAKGALIGATVGTAVGAGIGYAATGTKEGALEGAAIGFGAGSVVGAIAGGTVGGAGYSPPNAFKTYPTKQSNIDPKSLISQREHLSAKKFTKNFVKTIAKHGKIDERVIVNRNGMIIDGHHRVAIAKKLHQTVNILIK